MRAHSGGCAWRRDVGRIRANAVGGTAASAPGGNRTRGLRLESVTIVSRDVRDVAARLARSASCPMPFAMQFGAAREIQRRQATSSRRPISIIWPHKSDSASGAANAPACRPERRRDQRPRRLPLAQVSRRRTAGSALPSAPCREVAGAFDMRGVAPKEVRRFDRRPAAPALLY